MIGQKDQSLAGIGVLEMNATQVVRVSVGAAVAIERDGLVADDSSVAIVGRRAQPPRIHIALGAGYEEGASGMQDVQSTEIEVGPIHDAERARLDQQKFEHLDVVQLAIGNMDEARNAPLQVQQGVHLDRPLGRSERRSGKQRHAKVDRGRIERICCAVPVDIEWCVYVELAVLRDQTLGKVGIDPPVAFGVGIGQRGSANRLPESHLITLVGLGGKADFDVAQALPIGELSERHSPIVLSEGERLDVAVSLVALPDPVEAGPRQEIHRLRKQGLAAAHDGDLRSVARQNRRDGRSSRRHAASRLSC